MGFKPRDRSPYFFQSKKLFTLVHTRTSDLSLECFYVWKQASHDVLDSIGIVQAGGLTSSHKSLGNYFEGETPWVFFDLTDQVFSALKSAFLYALPQSCFSCFPCLMQQSITL